MLSGHQVRARTEPPQPSAHPPTSHSTPHLISSDTMPIPQWVVFTALFIDVAEEQWSAPRLGFVCSPFTVMLYQVACNSGHLQMLLLILILSGLAFNNSLKIVCQVDGIWWSIRKTFRGITADGISAIKKQMADDLKLYASTYWGKQWKIGAAVNPVTTEFKHQLQWNCVWVSPGCRQTIYWIEPDITEKPCLQHV